MAGKVEVKVSRRALELGVPIAYGMDSAVCPRRDNARQFAMMVKHGMAPLAAIQSATINGAELLVWTDHLASVEPGELADLIVVRGDPLNNVRVLEHVGFVMKDGQVLRNDFRRGRLFPCDA